MGKISKEEQARLQGMAYALKKKKEKGIEGLEEEIKFRYWVGYWHVTGSASMFRATAKGASLSFTFPYDGLSVRLVSTQTYK